MIGPIIYGLSSESSESIASLYPITEISYETTRVKCPITVEIADNVYNLYE